ncbi:Repeat domain-containing protein [Deinococcus reticulitermitis]|uniref:Repeat domain-containing protein n=1 Tax=Deinococcus reticulitermitis TaxID=856736 RepID=A0A1H7C9L1_9DEIO|nr:VCBS repeat-containing protein [Deinococcus reticulitermitis]SEJ83310.1 Repeat domain-containing protein [Deinococcus reticulitermitis]
MDQPNPRRGAGVPSFFRYRFLFLSLTLLTASGTVIPPSQAAAQSPTRTTRTATSPLIADFDGDGKTDVLGVGALDTSGRYTGSGGLFFRTGASRLQDEVGWSASTGAWEGYQFQLGDFDGDRKTDVLGVGALDEHGRYSGSGTLFFRTGASRLRDEVGWSAGAKAWKGAQFQVGDFDGDGKTDVLSLGALDESGRYTGSGCLLLWTQGLKERRNVTCDVQAWDGYRFQVGDFDGDGKDDLLGVGTVDEYGRYSGAGRLFYRTGASGLSREVEWAAGARGWKGHRFQVGDFDGDRKDDLLATGTVDPYGRSTGAGRFFYLTGASKLGRQVEWGAGARTQAWKNYRFQVGDFDGDGKDDLLGLGMSDAYGRYSGTGPLFYRTGASGLSREVEWAAGARGWKNYRFQVGDFDGDGKDDLLGLGEVDEAGRYAGRGRLFYRTGASGLGREVQWAGDTAAWNDYLLFPSRVTRPVAQPISPSFFTPALVDFNRDGRTEPFGFLNSGQGLVAQDLRLMGITQLRQSGRTPRDNRVADFNGDGHLDMLSNTYDCQNFEAQVAQLYLNNKDGTFRLDPQFSRLGLRGRGETIVTADFDNDGDLDVFLPYYADEIGGRSDGTNGEVLCDGRVSNAKHNPLLINNGKGQFRDIGLQTPLGLQRGEERPEGAQALDFDFDGWIDLYVSGRIFINTRGTNFKERTAEYKLPYMFEEGAKFLDWNNDGYFDLMQMHPQTGPKLLEFDGKVFRDITASALPQERYQDANGMNIYDMNNDGREDLLVMGGLGNQSGVLLNQGGRFVRSDFLRGLGNGRSGMGLGDIDGDGQVDVLYSGTQLRYFRNTLPAGPVPPLTVEVLGASGALNQHGRVIRVRPTSHRDVQFTRAVDGGSGYMAQNQYPVLIGTPYREPHTVEVIFAPLRGKSAPSLVRFTLEPGERAQVFAPSPAQPQGRVKISRAAPKR